MEKWLTIAIFKSVFSSMHPVLCPWLSQTRPQYFLVRDNLPPVFFVCQIVTGYHLNS